MRPAHDKPLHVVGVRLPRLRKQRRCSLNSRRKPVSQVRDAILSCDLSTGSDRTTTHTTRCKTVATIALTALPPIQHVARQ